MLIGIDVTTLPEAPVCIVPFKWIDCGVGYIIIRSPYTPYSIYLRGTVRQSPDLIPVDLHVIMNIDLCNNNSALQPKTDSVKDLGFRVYDLWRGCEAIVGSCGSHAHRDRKPRAARADT